VADLRVERSVERTAIHYETAADAGAHADIGERPDALSGAPLPLGPRSCVDVGVDHDAHGEATRESGAKIRAAPIGFVSV
jgi:hypothetical protein